MFGDCFGRVGDSGDLENEFAREYAKQAELGLDANQTVQKTLDAIKLQKDQDARYKAYMKIKDMQGIDNLANASETGEFSKNMNLSLAVLPSASATGRTASVYQMYKGLKATSGVRVNNIVNALSGKMFDLKQSSVNAYDFMKASYDLINGRTPEGRPEIIKAAKENLELNKEMFDRAIKAGAKINELSSRITGQKWSSDKLLKLYQLIDPKLTDYHERLNASRQAFIQLFEKYATPEDYRDEFGNVLSDEQRYNLIKESFHTIYTEGINKTDPEAPRVAGKTYERGNKTRELHINSADGWMEINNLIGSRKLHELIADNHDFMSKQIALLEWGGPNYRKNAEFIVKQNDLEASDLSKTKITKAELDSRKKAGENALKMLDWWAGLNRAPVKFDTTTLSGKAAKAYAGLTNLQLIKLGASVISSIGDFGQMGTSLSAYEKAGFTAFTNLVKNSYANLPNLKERKLMLNQAGLIAQTFEDSLWNDARDLADKGWTRLVGEGTLKATGLAKLDEYKKTIARITFLNGLGYKVKNYEFADIKGPDAKIFKSYGIDEKDWSILKMAKMGKQEFGNHLLSLDNIMEIPDSSLTKLGIDNPLETKQRLAEKIIGAAYVESNSVGIVTPMERQRYYTQSIVNRDGSLKGEIYSSMMMFKSFPIATMYNNWQRASSLGKAGGLGYAAKYVTYGMLAGGLTIQMKQLISGRDPRDMTNGQFWADSFTSFGGIGIVGDILLNAHQSKVGKVAAYIAGPTIDALGTGVELATRPFWNAAAKEERPDAAKNLAGDVVKYASDYVPLSKLWYTKMIFDRLLINDLQEWKSPGYNRRMMNRSLKNYNQRMYWEPDEVLPHRAPDLGAAVGE